jgi:nucleoside-diphosphate-sugar epimerase
MRRVLVTGANGFVGTALTQALAEIGIAVRGAVRSQASVPAFEAGEHTVRDFAAVGDLHGRTDWSAALQGVETVFHTAARVHMAGEPGGLAAYRTVNRDATYRLARQCVEAGVRRLIFLSTIKVNGETTQGIPFTRGDTPDPHGAYAVSKYEAEEVLWRVGAEFDLEVVVVRPPLVYGPRVKGNVLALLRWVDRGLPLPLAGIDNRRHLVGLSNLVDFLVACATRPQAAGQTFLVSDPEAVSTPGLVRRLAEALGRPARLFRLPPSLLRAAALLCGRGAMMERLQEDLEVDMGRVTGLLEWLPPTTMQEELARMAAWYRRRQAGGQSS